MKDRQPTQVLANGAIRYGVYNADGTLNHYEYLKREDAPTVEGTPLNKANLLSDATAAKIWPGSKKPDDPTVNDALGKLSEGTAKVGDIAITARTDLSDAWLRATGALYRRNSIQAFAPSCGRRTARRFGRKRPYQQTSERAATRSPTKTDIGSARTGTRHLRTFWYRTTARRGQSGRFRRTSGPTRPHLLLEL